MGPIISTCGTGSPYGMSNIIANYENINPCFSALYAIARPSVCPSHGWSKHKTVEDRIIQFHSTVEATRLQDTVFFRAPSALLTN